MKICDSAFLYLLNWCKFAIKAIIVVENYSFFSYKLLRPAGSYELRVG